MKRLALFSFSLCLTPLALAAPPAPDERTTGTAERERRRRKEAQAVRGSLPVRTTPHPRRPVGSPLFAFGDLKERFVYYEEAKGGANATTAARTAAAARAGSRKENVRANYGPTKPVYSKEGKATAPRRAVGPSGAVDGIPHSNSATADQQKSIGCKERDELQATSSRAKAADEKNAALRKLERVERYLGGSRDGGAGPFPGLAAGASLTLGTTGGLVVKRTPRIGVGTEYHILGKFQAQAAGDG